MDYPTTDLKVVGTRPSRPDGVDEVIGRAVFASSALAPWPNVIVPRQISETLGPLRPSRGLAVPEPSGPARIP